MSLNYVSAHLAWIKNNPKFLPKEQDAFQYGYDYYDMMCELYDTQRNSPYLQSYAERTYLMDRVWQQELIEMSLLLNKKVKKLKPTPDGWWFVTIGFNHATWNISDCCKAIEGILGMEWVIRAKANFELYRQNGEHPHCHFVIQTTEPKSRILDKIFRPLYVKKVVFSKNFIDVKLMMDYHKKYIMLEKVEEKMEHVQKDIEWREKNKIPNYEKNFDFDFTEV